MSFKPIECPSCHALLRSKYETRCADGSIKSWRWLQWCPVCGKRLRVVRDKELFNCVRGVEAVDE